MTDKPSQPKSSREVLQQRALVRNALDEAGFGHINTVAALRKVVVAEVGNEHLPEWQLFELYLLSIRQRAPTPKFIKTRPYVPDRAMRLAEEKSKFQPEMCGIHDARKNDN